LYKFNPTPQQIANIRKLISALRTNGYPQSRGGLAGPNGFCCLGVACDVYRQETGMGNWSTVGHMNVEKQIAWRYEIGNDHEIYYLPFQVMEHYGFTERNPLMLASQNDDGATFKEIASFLEGVVHEYTNK